MVVVMLVVMRVMVIIFDRDDNSNDPWALKSFYCNQHHIVSLD